MADGIDITPGTGKTVETDELANGRHAQVFKLAYGADGVATLVAADGNGLDVDPTRLPALVAGTAAIGDVGLIGRASGGLSIMRSLDIDETEEDVKTSAGQVYGYTFANQATAWRWLKFYNATAASVTVGTTTPVITVGLPPSSAGHVPWPQGIAFGTAISVAATTGIADNDTGAPAANDVSIHVFYT